MAHPRQLSMDELLKSVHVRPIAYYPVYTQITGSVKGAILLSQLMYWWSVVDGRTFDKTDDELRKETMLSIRELKTAKQKLKKLSFITIELHGIPARTYYTVDAEALAYQLEQARTYQHANNVVQNVPRERLEKNHSVGTKRANYSRDYPEIKKGEGKEPPPVGTKWKPRPKTKDELHEEAMAKMMEEATEETIQEWMRDDGLTREEAEARMIVQDAEIAAINRKWKGRP